MKRILLILFSTAIMITLVSCNSKPSVVSKVSTTTQQPDTNQAKTPDSKNTISDSNTNPNPDPDPQKESSNTKNTITQPIASDSVKDNSKIAEKLDKVKDLQELQKQKTFMMIIAQDDLEHYTWREESAYPDIWRQAYLKYNYNGNQVMLALQSDIDTYLAYGNSDYALVWALADLTYETYKSGKLQAKMTEQEYQKFRDNLNAINKRLGIIYTKREYVS